MEAKSLAFTDLEKLNLLLRRLTQIDEQKHRGIVKTYKRIFYIMQQNSEILDNCNTTEVNTTTRKKLIDDIDQNLSSCVEKLSSTVKADVPPPKKRRKTDK